MRTTQINRAEKIIKKSEISNFSLCSLSPKRAVLTLTAFERKGGET